MTTGAAAYKDPRQGGEAFRLGGDEFAILLPGRDEEGSRIAAEAILERIAAVELEPAGLSRSA